MRGYSFLRLVIAGMGLDCLDQGLIPAQSVITESINDVESLHPKQSLLTKGFLSQSWLSLLP